MSVFEYTGRLKNESINQMMSELSEKIGYSFRDIGWLKKAFYCKITTQSGGEKYANSPMATLGDRVLSLIIAERLFDEEKTSEMITSEKSDKERNTRWYTIREKMSLQRYAFNDNYFFDNAPQNERLPNSKHDRYFEALAAAIYKDSPCFDQTRDVIEKLLEKWG